MGYAEYKDYRDRNQSLAGVAAFSAAAVSLSSNGINERVWGYHVTGNYFGLLGVGASLGRVITPADATPLDAETRLQREFRFEPDLLVIEAEDRQGRHFLDLAEES